ncbi:hypothetical protein BDQ17DRAFT_1392014 [Cyathus striatus]|nr:hypothetical protein BDQ17DRAFT_1392014 [Cyathus striatus]
MFFSIPLLSLLLLVPSAVFSSPIATTNNTAVEVVVPRSLGRTGSYTIPSLGKRKKQLLSCGANSLDLAIAMLETDRMSTDYVYGDAKSRDAANFGVFKQNWGMLRQSVSRYNGKSEDSFNTGSELNRDICLDIKLRHESSKHFGEGVWFAGHRNGARLVSNSFCGLRNPNTQDIQNYKDAVYWIRNQLQYNNRGKIWTC